MRNRFFAFLRSLRAERHYKKLEKLINAAHDSVERFITHYETVLDHHGAAIDAHHDEIAKRYDAVDALRDRQDVIADDLRSARSFKASLPTVDAAA